MQIRRKAVPQAPTASGEKAAETADAPPPYPGPRPGLSDDLRSMCINEKWHASPNEAPQAAKDEKAPPQPPRPNATPLKIDTTSTPQPGISTRPSIPLSSPSSSATPSSAGPSATPTTPSTSKSFLSTAASATRHFATGLIPHPQVSTKHYTILRHSPSLIFYRGPTTSVVITIFSSPKYPYPPPPGVDGGDGERSLWLQRRGFSGNSGMRLKNLVGATSTWLDVTPQTRVEPDAVASKNEEKDWERDIERGAKKLRKEIGSRKAHVPRETMVVRLPGGAGDGYFRLVLCNGGKAQAQADGTMTSVKRRILCTSPVFRVASTKTDSSVLRGASLSSMPMELGVKIGSIAGKIAAGSYVSAVAAPVVSPIAAQMGAYKPNFVERTAAQGMYKVSGAGKKVESWDEKAARKELGYDEKEIAKAEAEGEVDWGGSEDDAPPEVMGPDERPVKPFPLAFQAKVVKGRGRWMTDSSALPTANLAELPNEVLLRLPTREGIYFGWAQVLPSKKLAPEVSTEWYEAVISIGPNPYAAPSVASRTRATVHLLHDFDSASFVDAKLDLMIMGFLRPDKTSTSPKTAEVNDTVRRDAVVTIASLSRENWGPDVTIERMEAERKARSFGDKYVDAKQGVQKQVDRIPFHLVGIRAGAELQDRIHGNGGFWIPR